jgi:hypothetical protein
MPLIITMMQKEDCSEIAILSQLPVCTSSIFSPHEIDYPPIWLLSIVFYSQVVSSSTNQGDGGQQVLPL